MIISGDHGARGMLKMKPAGSFNIPPDQQRREALRPYGSASEIIFVI
jgi:hypothetical protein